MSTAILLPTSDGDYGNNFDMITGDAVNHYANIDEYPTSDETATMMGFGLNTYNKEIYGFENLPANAGTINSVKLKGHFWGEGLLPNQDSIKFEIYSDVSNYIVSSAYTLSGSAWQYIEHEFSTAPDGGAWAAAKINAMQAGLHLRYSNSKGAVCYCSQLYLIVDYDVAVTTDDRLDNRIDNRRNRY